MNFTTQEINIKNIVNKNFEFLIPVYQRPYVWDNLEINKLLEDLKSSFKHNKENKYYVGNTYVIKSNNEKKPFQFEVIDGQQRFTTFWLISYCFESLKIETDLSKYMQINNDIRFDFDIRKEVYEYLKGLIDGTSENRFRDVSQYIFLKNIAAGIETIKGILKQLINEAENFNLLEFGNYIYEKVFFIFNEAPLNTDLNALFVALGTSGIQLQQSDILKARLLDKIPLKNQRIQFAKIWESCENMNNYFEKNVNDSFSYDNSKINKVAFKSFDEFLKNQETGNFEDVILEEKKGYKISEIIIKDIDFNIDDEVQIKIKNTDCRSIINFNMFLLHVLRIYKKEKNQDDITSIDSKKLLEIFKIDEIDDVIDLFKLIWKVRYQFDRHVIKWIKDEDENIDENEKLLLSEINEKAENNRRYFSRSDKAFSNLQMLQSVLYFNNIPNQIWLTPFLDYLINNQIDNSDDSSLLNQLEKIDNILLPGDKKQASWNLLTEKTNNFDFENIKSMLNSSLSTSFNHYWFYKLEYILWKNWKDREKIEFKRFRITSKNSIEHVFPQNQEFKIKLNNLNDDIDWLNSFGNLTLLSVGQNSSYSNDDVRKKRINFEGKTAYDSLKLAEIFFLENWNSKEIKKHQEEMIIIFENHYNI